MNRRAVLDRDGWTCRMPVCLHPEADGGRAIDPVLDGTQSRWAPTVDHIRQRSDGGTNAGVNLRAAHAWCNQEAGRTRLRPRLTAVAVVTEGAGRRRVRHEGGVDVYDRLRQAERDQRAASA